MREAPAIGTGTIITGIVIAILAFWSAVASSAAETTGSGYRHRDVRCGRRRPFSIERD